MRDFRICTTTKPYSSKDAEYGCACFEQDLLDILSFSKLIGKGYGFTSGIFSDSYVSMKEKSNANMKSCSLIVVDMDGACMGMEDCVSLIRDGYKPTLAYETMSNGEKGNRYRLVYLVSQEFSPEKYPAYAHALVDFIGIEQECIDPRTYVPSQFWMGTKPSRKLMRHNTTIDISWLEELSKVPIQNISKVDIRNNIYNNDFYIKEKKEKKVIISNVHFSSPFTPEILSFFKENDYGTFLSEYNGRIEHVVQSYIDDDDSGDSPCISIPEGSYSILIPYGAFGRKKILRDGEMRRRHLYFNAVRRRLIKPDISADELLYGTVWDIEDHISNDKDPIGKKFVIDTVVQVLESDAEELVMKYSDKMKDKRKRKASQAYCEKHGVRKKAAVMIARGIETDDRIARSYNPELNDKDNAAAIGVSVKTLRRWREKYNIESSRRRSKPNNRV